MTPKLYPSNFVRGGGGIKNSSTWFNVYNEPWMVHFKGSQVIISEVIDVFQFMENITKQWRPFHLGVHCLLKYPFRGI